MAQERIRMSTNGCRQGQAANVEVAVSAALVCLCLGCAPSAEGPAPDSAPSGWLDEVQTYCMVPVLPETAAALHVTVNGVWAGMGGTHPVLTHREVVPAVEDEYEDDPRGFVDACHRAGLVVPSVVNGLEGFLTMREAWPKLASMACRDIDGKPAQVNEKMLLMCTNNPDWQQWQVDCGRRGIDLGADLVLLDTPMSASFISGFLKGGFCQHCMAYFERHLERKFTAEQRRERFGLTEFDAAAVSARLSPLQDLANPASRPHHNASPDDLLFREFIYCQEQAGFDTCRRLIDTLREYAKAQGREVAFATNAADLGTTNPGGHWVRALMFADLFDLFVYEQNLEPNGMMSDEVTKYPRGKWAAYHKLAYAIHHRRGAAVIHAGAMGAILGQVLTEGQTTNTWFAVQSAEAYAANGAYVQYYVEPGRVKRLFLRKCWEGSARHAAFVQSHRDLYEGDLHSGSPLAVLFLYNERGRTIPAVYPSYLGFAQALVEGNYPFDVVFAGDGYYVQDGLTADALRPYRALLVPSPIAPTENQVQVVRDFVKAGGTLVCQEPAALGLAGDEASVEESGVACIERQFAYGEGRVLVLRGSVSETWTDDVGSSFFRTYQPDLREQVWRLAETLGPASIVPGETSGLITAFPILQPDRNRVVLHLVNCDIDFSADTIREKVSIPICLPEPGFLGAGVAATLHVPEQDPQPLDVQAADGKLSLTVPCLGVSAVVAIEPQPTPNHAQQ